MRRLPSTQRFMWLPTLTALLMIPLATVHAQQGIDYSISNEFRYGTGERYEQEVPIGKEYLENMFNTRVYAGDFTLGFRLEVDKPREYGRDTIGLKEYFGEFQRDNLRVRGGMFYNLLGRGLLMNTFESRPLGFDTETEGVKIDYRSQDVSAQAFGGIMNYTDILTFTRTEQYLLRGISGEVHPLKEIGVGGSFMTASGRKTPSGFTRPFDAYMREAFLDANYSGLRAYLNYADKRTQLDSADRARTTSLRYGYATYGLLGYSNSDVGVTAEYKNYRYDLVEPNEQNASGRATRALPFQNGPTLILEHDKTLLARNPHAIDFSDELGFQLETLLYPKDGLTVTLVANGGSRHNAWQAKLVKDSAGVNKTVYERINAAPLSFPELKDIRYSPFWEVFAHGEYEVSDRQTFAIGIQRKDNILYGEGNGDVAPSSETYKASTLMLESISSVGQADNLHAILELQQVYDSKKALPATDSTAEFDGMYKNVLLTLEYTHSPRWAVNGRLEWTTTDHEQGGRRLWPVLGATYRIGTAHTVGLQYGAERGGVVCTGGVCRLINPFNGVRLTVTSKL
ncbi:MAG TPA: DUF6029 family protein [Candidatus Kapabacteria bacterium]|nr:DUF6029 family protein [Candidatus Kapabacteria bacterium]